MLNFGTLPGGGTLPAAFLGGVPANLLGSAGLPGAWASVAAGAPAVVTGCAWACEVEGTGATMAGTSTATSCATALGSFASGPAAMPAAGVQPCDVAEGALQAGTTGASGPGEGGSGTAAGSAEDAGQGAAQLAAEAGPLPPMGAATGSALAPGAFPEGAGRDISAPPPLLTISGPAQPPAEAAGAATASGPASPVGGSEPATRAGRRTRVLASCMQEDEGSEGASN